MLSLMVASSGMMFSLVPACSEPTVSTALSSGEISRETMVCRRSTVEAAITTGSIEVCGCEPCEPRPNSLHLQAVARRQDHAGTVADGAGGPDHHVLAEHDVRMRQARAIPVRDHRVRALRHFLAGLEHHQRRAAPRVARFGQHARGAHQPGDVQVVPAGMRDADLSPIRVGGRRLAGIRQAGVLGHRQRVHVGAQHHRRAVAIAQHADHAGHADLAASPRSRACSR